MHIQVLDLNHLLATFTKLLSRMLGEHIHVVNEFAQALPPIKADAGMIEQIIMNLAVNARDAMPEGGRIIIRTELQVIDAAGLKSNPKARLGRFACLSVEDIGTGISPEDMSRIFEPFFTTKGAGKGTGLGLATVFSIAQQHNGWVDVSSQLGVGSAFRVFLPVTTESIPATHGAAHTDIRGRGERILLAEDDKALRAVMAKILQRQGYAVLEADSGISARQVWIEEEQKIDLLLTDMVMTGGVNGLELAEMLRLEKPGLKVVLTSGFSSQLVGGDLLSAQKLLFLKKPFSSQRLAEAVRQSLDAA